jgi:hypothetical protein
MPAPKGNKYGKDSTTSGRPPKFDLEEEAKALIEWAHDDESLVLRLFAAIRGYADQGKLTEYAERSEAFRQAYNQAKILIGARRERLIIKGKGNPAAFQRYAALYDPELKQHEKEMKLEENNTHSGTIKLEFIDYKNAI